MCGIAGFISLKGRPINNGEAILNCMSRILAHRGPDGQGSWINDEQTTGLAHTRLAIIDLNKNADQPMKGQDNSIISLNGEIYNYLELRDSLSPNWNFSTKSDTETVLASYHKFGDAALDHLRGMFSFALWDENNKRLFCARDRFGIKPFYYAIIKDVFYFASEAKALLPVLQEIETDGDALAEYLTFNFVIGENTLFKGIKQLLPGHSLIVENGLLSVTQYWDVNYEIDWDHREEWFQAELRQTLDDSIRLHLRSDVPVGAYLSGGIDSSLMSILASRENCLNRESFHGRFLEYPGYDESEFAQYASDQSNGNLNIKDIKSDDFRENLEKVIYHLDYPVAGPGSFPQYMISQLASEKVKVVLGGQGGDEIFGGYTRYLLAYFEQCINAAIDGTYKNGNFVVTIESIIPNLGILREYKPMMQEFWREGLFEDLDQRYFRLINRSSDMEKEIDWSELDKGKVFDSFQKIFLSESNVRKGAYFDHMTHFDFKTLLPALLQVEDRMSMAHGLESRVPLLDHKLVELMATTPADIKFSGGNMKYLLKQTYKDVLPDRILNRRDKMGFPVPLKEWLGSELKDMVEDIFYGMKKRNRPFINSDQVLSNFQSAGRFSRKVWSLMSLEIWHQVFHDRNSYYKSLLK